MKGKIHWCKCCHGEQVKYSASKCCPVREEKKDCVVPPNKWLFDQLSAFDKSVMVRYIPSRPAQLGPDRPPQYEPGTTYPWFSNVIPAEPLDVNVPLPTLPGTQIGVLPNYDGYGKFQSLPYKLPFYMGLDMRTISPTDEQLSIFITDLKDRGDDNYRKRVYMSALTCGLMGNYKEKTDSFVNSVYANVVTYNKPLLSSFEHDLIRYFLALHVGYDTYPEVVIEYFRRFVRVLSNVEAASTEEREADFMYGYQHVQCVRDYFNRRNDLILESQDETTLMYHWHEAGLSSEGLVMEAIHNIIAFFQFSHMLYLLVLDSVSGTPIPLPPGTRKYDFFQKYKDASGNPTEQLNVIREAYRLLVPNGAAFSRVKQAIQDDPPVTVQSRHIHKAIMAQNAAVLAGGNQAAYFQYSTAKYAPFNTNFSECVCPVQPNDPISNFDPAELFEVSPIDGETLLDKCNKKMFPVFPLPIYASFGLGYRRCPGETFNYMVTLKLVDKFKDLTFEFREPATNYPEIGLAPGVTVRDNIFLA